MFSSDQNRQGFDVGANSTLAGSVPPYMMMYGSYPKTNGGNTAVNFGNQRQVATNPAVNNSTPVFRHPYSLPMVGFSNLPGVAQEEEEIEGIFEVHDSHLKAPILVRPGVVFPSVGSQNLFSAQHQAAGFGSRNNMRICEPFQEGRCILGEACTDIHVYPEYLASTRQAMVSWLQSKEREFQQSLAQDPGKVFRVFCADLKEVVEVPIAALRFTKGLYVDPSMRARRARSGHQNQFAMMASQVPTACGLFSADPSQCKWGRWCNQVHIELAWMHSKKNEFESWSNNLEKCFNSLPPNYLFTVHDPQLKTSLSLPKASIAGFSRGLFQGSAKKAPSVCMLFQRNRCTASACCNQIHVVPPYLHLHRQWVHSGEQLSAEERKDLFLRMKNMLATLAAQSETDSTDVNDAAGQGRELNPEAWPYVPTPPPQGLGETPEVRRDIEKTPPNNNGERPGVPLVSHPSLMHPSHDGIISSENEAFYTPVKMPAFTKHQQAQQGRPPSAHESGNSNPRNLRSTSTGCVLPLGDLVVVVDGDERSQSSLQASHSNLSHAGRSYRHTNNPYTLGGSTSCTASPSFGWVQPVRSAGNSCTTFPAAGASGDGGAHHGNGVWGARARGESFGGTDTRLVSLGFPHHDFDGSLHTLSPSSLPWNASGSVGPKVTEDVHKNTPEMDSSFVGSNSFFGQL
ncbi:hypothetical protein DQ04_02401000 [Trypanosoma grayi]|uniref:hypothetical protein n=1 Tax=Trypanosoma grayi TaxID=71804 RepID=UPI0004F4496D|nr:hypothetical protein DQ04_02401000 [Trypanosoma grayi]KEG11646.1 hypothetical protein DQ04_02401000 [Trypanosoma grayi]